jgi:hypothetical protein
MSTNNDAADTQGQKWGLLHPRVMILCSPGNTGQVALDAVKRLGYITNPEGSSWTDALAWLTESVVAGEPPRAIILTCATTHRVLRRRDTLKLPEERVMILRPDESSIARNYPLILAPVNGGFPPIKIPTLHSAKDEAEFCEALIRQLTATS